VACLRAGIGVQSQKSATLCVNKTLPCSLAQESCASSLWPSSPVSPALATSTHAERKALSKGTVLGILIAVEPESRSRVGRLLAFQLAGHRALFFKVATTSALIQM